MRFILKVSLAVLLALGVGTTQIDAALAQKSASLLPTSEELTELLGAFDVPGVAVATLTGCEVDGVVVAGSAMLAPDVAVAPQTAFEAASLSKPVFAWLVLALADEGVIDLDRPIAQVFDYERIPDKAMYAEITPRTVLTHRTGLPNWVDERVKFHDRTAPIPFEHPPGTAYSYSGEAFQLLQAYVERLTGTTLEVLFRERLGDIMPHSTFAQPLPYGVTPSRGYRAAGDPMSGRDMTSLRARAMAAASLATTAMDYARFLAHVCMREGLQADTYADMLRAQSPVPEGEVASAPTSWGLGWMLADLGYGTFVGHGGDNNEYRALAGFIRESGDGLVVLTNGYNGRALIDAIAAPPSSEGPPQNPPLQMDETP